jgi:hypothetical protein
MKTKNQKIDVKGISVSVFQTNDDDYISLTDIAKSKEGDMAAPLIKRRWHLNWIVTYE